MQTFFTHRNAIAMVAVAVSLSLMSFSEVTYVPSGLGSSQEVLASNLENSEVVDQAIVAALARTAVRATRAAVNYTRVTVNATRAYTPEVDRLLLTSSTYTVFAQLSKYDNDPEVALSKAIKVKMKALG